MKEEEIIKKIIDEKFDSIKRLILGIIFFIIPIALIICLIIFFEPYHATPSFSGHLLFEIIGFIFGLGIPLWFFWIYAQDKWGWSKTMQR